MIQPVISRIPLAPLGHLLGAVARNGGVSPRRLHILAAMVARYTLTEPLRLLERARLDGALDAAPLEAGPLFVLGHWRSGTSHLQALLSVDPRHTTTTLYRSLLSDISSVSEPWLKPPLGRLARRLGVRYSLQRMPLDFDLPAEGDIALCCQLSPCSYSWGHIFPRRFPDWLDRWVLDPSPEDAAAWLAAYDRFLRKVALAGGGRRVVMKSPGDTARLSRLAARYPGAQFVYIHRDPIAVFHSCRYLWQVIRREYSLHTLTDDEVDALILQTYPRLLGRYREQRERLAPGRLVEVAYEDLRDDPHAELERIYVALGLGPLPAATRAALAALPRRDAQQHTTPPDLERRIRAAWAIGFTERSAHA